MQRIDQATNVLQYSTQSVHRRWRRALLIALIPALFIVTYSILHSCGHYHACYRIGKDEPGSLKGWIVQDEIGLKIVDGAFRPAIIFERMVRDRLDSYPAFFTAVTWRFDLVGGGAALLSGARVGSRECRPVAWSPILLLVGSIRGVSFRT